MTSFPVLQRVVERYGFHHWIAQRISCGEVVSVFLYLVQFPSYDVIMSDADCTPGREPRSVVASHKSFTIRLGSKCEIKLSLKILPHDTLPRQCQLLQISAEDLPLHSRLEHSSRGVLCNVLYKSVIFINHYLKSLIALLHYCVKYLALFH